MNLVRILLITMICVMAATWAEAGVSVTPERHIVRLSPGESQTIEYQVYNSGPQDLDIEIDPNDWTGIQVEKRIDINSWLSLKEDRFGIKAGETKPLNVKITAPDGVEGEMLAMLFLCYKEDKNSPLNVRNGTPLYLVIKGTERYNARIETIKVGYAKELQRNDLAIMVKVENEGNVHIVPDIAVFVKDGKGDEVKSFLLKRPKIILRGKYHTYRLSWRNPKLAEGNYTVTAGLSYEDRIEGVEGTADFEIKDGKPNMLRR